MDIAKARQIATDVLDSYVEARHISDHHIAGAQLAVSIAILDELRKWTDDGEENSDVESCFATSKPLPPTTIAEIKLFVNGKEVEGTLSPAAQDFVARIRDMKFTEGEPDGPDCG